MRLRTLAAARVSASEAQSNSRALATRLMRLNTKAVWRASSIASSSTPAALTRSTSSLLTASGGIASGLGVQGPETGPQTQIGRTQRRSQRHLEDLVVAEPGRHQVADRLVRDAVPIVPGPAPVGLERGVPHRAVVDPPAEVRIGRPRRLQDGPPESLDGLGMPQPG